MKTKIKLSSKVKKIMVLSVMVVLLVTTGVLNFVLNDKLDSANNQAGIQGGDNVTETFFAACRSERKAVRESELMYLDAILKSDSSSAKAKDAAEAQQKLLIDRMELENNLETIIKAKGYEDTIVTINDSGINAIVIATNFSAEQSNQVATLILQNIDFVPADIHVMQYDRQA